jgi:hypothetical protein
MAKDPAFLFYSSDFIVGTQTMNWEDRGKYITILALMHQQGRMDDETIRFLVGSFSDKLISKFEKDDNGMYYNVRLEEEIEKRSNFVDSRRINGSKGGRPKASGKPNDKPSGKTKINLLEDVNENEDEIENRSINTDRNIKNEYPDFETFLNHAYEKAVTLNIELDEVKVKAKFISWSENNWRTLGDKPRKIQNWKSTLTNSLVYCQQEKNGQPKLTKQQESDEKRNNEIKRLLSTPRRVRG